MIENYKYKDKKHPPIPIFSVGDKCYMGTNPWDYSTIGEYTIRRVTVKWEEATDTAIAHWNVAYRIKGSNSDYYEVGDNNDTGIIYKTPEEALYVRAEQFMKNVNEQLEYFRRRFKSFGMKDNLNLSVNW